MPTTLAPEELRARRRGLRLTQAALGRALGVTANTVARWERGQQRLANPQLLHLALERLELGVQSETKLSDRPAAYLPRSHNLPPRLTSFVGRRRELGSLRQLVREARLVTVTGVAGIGKTRLALEVARGLVGRFLDGVWLIELATLDLAALVPQTVAAALHIPEQAGRDALQGLVASLAEQRLLLVLDNCEHLVAACSELITAVLLGCPGVHILATSRTVLGMHGEATWRVPPLSLPAAGGLPGAAQLLTRSESVALFVERAQAVRPGFGLTDQNSSAVARICARLDGLPLALELAAARVRVLAPEQILDRLDDVFAVLVGGSRAAPARQQTLRAALDWSYALLTSAERDLLQRLAVFGGGFHLDAVEAVRAEDAEPGALEVLTGLVDQSLVLAQPEGERLRYRLLEPVRQYARRRLAAAGSGEAARRRHAEHFLALAERADRELEGTVGAWLDHLEMEHTNLRVALAWTVEHAEVELGLRLAVALWRFWDMHSHVGQGLGWLSRLLELPAPPQPSATRAQALTAAGYLALLAGEAARAQEFLNQGLGVWRELDDRAGEATALFFLGLLAGWARGEGEPARLLLEASLRLAEQAGPRWVRHMAPIRLADLARTRGDAEHAEALLEGSRALAEAEADPWSRAMALRGLGHVRLQRDDPGGAERLFAESLRVAGRFGDVRGISQCLDGLACVAAARGQAVRAARLFGAAEHLRDELGTPFRTFLEATRPWSTRLRSAPDRRARIAGAWAAGRMLSAEQATAEALREVEALAAGPVRNALTPREWQVARLVASGLSNRETARHLVIAESTAQRHVANILAKLGLTSRAQIATWTLQHAAARAPDSGL